MAIINRISRLFKADFNAVLDTLEDPEVLLRHSIREMQACISDSEGQLEALSDAVAVTEERISRLLSGLEKLNSELDVCFMSGEDELAKRLIQRKLEHQLNRDLLQNRLAEYNKEKLQLSRELQSKHETLACLIQKAELVDSHYRSGSTEFGNTDERIAIAISQDEIEIAFLQEKNSRTSS